MPKKMPYDYPVLDNKPIDQWRVTELREELRRRELVTKGLKEELVRRLDEAIRNEMEPQNDGDLGDGIDGKSDVQNSTEENEADPAGEDNTDILNDENKKDDADTGMVDINLGFPDINQGSEDQNREETKVAGLATLVDKEVAIDTEDNASCNQNVISQSCTQVEAVPIEKHDDSKPLIEESAVIQSEPNNQVPDVNQGLEFQVNYVSINDSVSFNDKNNIKDILTADNLPLELEVVNQEVRPPSSRSYPLIGVDACIICDEQVAGFEHLSHVHGSCENHVLDEQDTGKNLMSDEKEGTKNIASDGLDDGHNHVFVGQEAIKVHAPLEDAGVENDSNVDTPKKEDSAVGESSEKVNLDRSSGDESMNEDIPEHKLIETEIKSEEPADKFEVKHELDDSLGHLSNVQGSCENHVLDEQDMGKYLMLDEKEVTTNFVSDRQDDGDSHVFVGQETIKVHAPLEDAGVENDSSLETPKKEDSADVGSPEKVNLDRISGDESMDEDMSEHKLIETEIKSEEPADKFEVKHELDDGASDMTLSKFSLAKNDTASDDAKSVFIIEKRKVEESEAVTENDAPKRQRRWNPDTIKVPEQQTPQVSIFSTYKSDEQPPLRPTFSRSNSMLSGDSPRERIVPQPKKLATSSLRIDNFLRPFTLKAVQDLLAKTGKVCDFWMDHIKTHCYVTFSSVEEATETRNAVYNLQWPPNGGRFLVAEFVDPQEVKMRLEALPQSPAPGSPNLATPTVAPPPRTQVTVPIFQQSLMKQQLQLPLPPPLAQPPLPPLSNTPIAVERAQRHQATPEKPEPPVATLDDLFKKTRSSPRIYYLPLSEKQVAVKLAAQGKSSTQV